MDTQNQSPQVPQVPEPVHATHTAEQQPAVRYVGVWYRFLAQFLDGIIVAVIGSPFLIAIFVIGFMQGYSEATRGIATDDITLTGGQSLAVFVLTVLYVIFVFCYYIFTTASKLQGTLAKRMLGIKVVDGDGKRISIGTSATRMFVAQGLSLPYSILSNSTIVPLRMVGSFFGFIHFVFYIVDASIGGGDAKKQTVHDRIAKTYVVYR